MKTTTHTHTYARTNTNKHTDIDCIHTYILYILAWEHSNTAFCILVGQPIETDPRWMEGNLTAGNGNKRTWSHKGAAALWEDCMFGALLSIYGYHTTSGRAAERNCMKFGTVYEIDCGSIPGLTDT